jgi:hypothetical protein
LDIFKNVQKSKARANPGKNPGKKDVVTIMLSFSFFIGKCCDANIFREKYLGDFSIN